MAEKDQAVVSENVSDSSNLSVLIVTDKDNAHPQVAEFIFSLMSEDPAASSPSDIELVDVPAEVPAPCIVNDMRKSCCRCGYKAVTFPTKTPEPICRECAVYDNPHHSSSDFVVGWMPDHTKEAVSAMVKLLAVMAVATKEDQLLEHYTAPDGYHFASAVDKLFDSAGNAFSDVSDILNFISKHCETIVQQIVANFKKSVVDAKDIFGTDSLKEYLRLYDVADEITKEMMGAGVRFIPHVVTKDQTGKQQIAHFLRNMISAFGNAGMELKGVTSRSPVSEEIEKRNDVPSLSNSLEYEEFEEDPDFLDRVFNNLISAPVSDAEKADGAKS